MACLEICSLSKGVFSSITLVSPLNKDIVLGEERKDKTKLLEGYQKELGLFFLICDLL